MFQSRPMRIVAHVFLFAVAIAVFYVGLGVGLIRSPIAGTLLWLAALVIAGLNLWWMVRSSGR